MARIMEIFVIVNAACGIAAFLIAKNVIKRAKRKITGEEESRQLHQ